MWRSMIPKLMSGLIPKLIPMLIPVLVLATGCTQFPELDDTQTPGVAEAPYPRLVPLEQLTTPAREPLATPEMVTQVEGRIDGLVARAERLKRVQVSQATSVPDRLDRCANGRRNCASSNKPPCRAVARPISRLQPVS